MTNLSVFLRPDIKGARLNGRRAQISQINRYHPVLLQLIRGTKPNLAHMAIEQVERQEPENDCLSCPKLSSEIPDKDKEELALARDPDTGITPYSIYTHSEKWFIVSMASLAALFR